MAVIVQWTAGLCCFRGTFVNEKVILCSEGTCGALAHLDVALVSRMSVTPRPRTGRGRRENRSREDGQGGAWNKESAGWSRKGVAGREALSTHGC